MSLVSAPTALYMSGAVVGIALIVALTDLPMLASIAIGGFAGSALAAALFGAVAERADARLHRLSGCRRQRRSRKRR